LNEKKNGKNKLVLRHETSLVPKNKKVKKSKSGEKSSQLAFSNFRKNLNTCKNEPNKAHTLTSSAVAARCVLAQRRAF
jgi:hypothetical protein